jgi:hypothetical protein
MPQQGRAEGSAPAKALSNAPQQPAPESGVPDQPDGESVQINLVHDPSLEEAALGEQFPSGWGRYNAVPKGSYTFEVVEGGRTGNKSCVIEGDGQYITLPTNRVSVESDKRYAARGWVKLEGAGSSAQVRILYFDVNRRYIGENRLGHVTPHDQWQLVSITDRVEEHPNARYLALAMSVMGKGKAMFDDLELLAFDNDQLPDNFETEYGRTVTIQSRVLDRWLGQWGSRTTYKPTESFPRAGTTLSSTNAAKILDGHFVQLHTTTEAGDEQFLTLIGYDESKAAYRLWIYLSNGAAYERIGQWDDARSTLTLELVPPAPGVTGTSVYRFVDADTIEASLVVKNAAAEKTRDITDVMTRKGEQASADLPGTVELPELSPEQHLLDQYLGDWEQAVTLLPAAWTPRQIETTGTYTCTRILDGRFVHQKNLESDGTTHVHLYTYDANRKHYRRWYFNSSGHTSEATGTWDAAANTMTWQADTGNGVTNTAITRFVDADTIEWNVIVKDQDGKLFFHGEGKSTRAR